MEHSETIVVLTDFPQGRKYGFHRTLYMGCYRQHQINVFVLKLTGTHVKISVDRCKESSRWEPPCFFLLLNVAETFNFGFVHRDGAF